MGIFDIINAALNFGDDISVNVDIEAIISDFMNYPGEN